MLQKFCVIWIFATSLHYIDVMGKSHSKFTLYTRVCFRSKELSILFCVIIICCPVGYVWERFTLKEYHTKGVEFEVGFGHEHKGPV